MRVVSWNVNGIRACVKKGFAGFLQRAEADIIGVQEVRALYEEIPDEARTPAGWHAAFVAAERRGYSGVGILFEDRARAGGDRARRAPVRHRGPLHRCPTFARSGDASRWSTPTSPKGDGKNRDNSRVPYKLDFYRAVFERVQRIRRRCPVLVIGDYNTAHREIDLARPKANVKNSGFLPIERAEIDRWLEAGWVDTFRALHPDEPDHYSWWTQAGRRAGAERRLADRLRDRLAGRDEAGGERLHLARADGLRSLPCGRGYRPLASQQRGHC